MDDMVELWVGHDTHIFKRHVRQAIASGKPVAAGPHLSFSLLLKSTLPVPPAASAEVRLKYPDGPVPRRSVHHLFQGTQAARLERVQRLCI